MDGGASFLMSKIADKTCRFCNQAKPLTEGFYTHRASAGGYSTKCKECTKAYEKNRRLNCYEATRAYEASRAKDPARRALTIRVGREWRERNPEKRRAQRHVWRALKKGTLVRKPCERCGAEKTDAHHEDYSKPLVVMFLCSRCHKHRHQEIKAGLLSAAFNAAFNPRQLTSEERAHHLSVVQAPRAQGNFQ